VEWNVKPYTLTHRLFCERKVFIKDKAKVATCELSDSVVA